MEWHFNPLAAPLLLGVVVVVGIIGLAWPQRSSLRVRAMIAFAVAHLFYTVGYIFELGSTTVAGAQTWIKIEYVGIVVIPVAVFVMAMTYLPASRFQAPATYLLLMIIPCVTLVLAWTNEQHGLIWREMRMQPFGDNFILDFTSGVWYPVNLIYLWAGLLGAAVVMHLVYRRSTGIHRKQAVLFLLGLSFPIVGHILYLMRVLPVNLDLSPYALILSNMVLALAVLNYRMLDLAPVAHEAVLAGMSDALIVLDERQTVVELNAAAQRLAGRDLDAVIGLPAAAVFPDWFASVPLSGRELVSTEIAVERQGETRHYDLRSSPLRSRLGQPDGRMIVLRDITARVRAEHDLRESNRRLKMLREVDAELSSKLDVNYVGDITLDAAMRMSRAETAFIAFQEEGGLRLAFGLGNCPPGVIGRLIPPQTGLVARVLATGQPILIPDVSQEPEYYALVPGTRAEITVPLLSGRKLIGVINLETAHPEHFTPEAFESVQLLAARAAVAIDNSYMYEERQKLVNELDAFSHTVAHDLKGPLSVIKGYTELLLPDIGLISQDDLVDYISAMRRGAEKAEGIIQSLLLLAGVRLKENVVLEPVAMGQVVTEALLRLEVARTQLQAEIVQPETWPDVIGYGPWIEEIWANYIGNALKYGGKPPQISLGYETRPGGQIRFWVRDNGPGLTPEEQARLFRPFTRLGKTHQEGHGLGLSIVQRIAERLRGEVGVESTPGQGSLFFFTLPAVTGQPEDAWPMPAHQPFA